MTNNCPKTCEICNAKAMDIHHCDGDVLVLRRPFGILIAPRRHVSRWRELTAPEQAALTGWIAPAQEVFGADARPEVIFAEDGPHVHLRILKPPVGNGLLPGLPHDRALISGGEDALHSHLLPYIDRAQSIDLAVSFLMQSGVRLILPHLRDMLARGGRLRLLTGDYLDVTEPDALRLMLDLDGARALYAFQAHAIPFHPKAWMFCFDDDTGALLVGSSNLSKSALTSGVEWNLRLFDRADAAPLIAATAAFEGLLAGPEVTDLTEEWVTAYETRRAPQPSRLAGVPEEPATLAPQPHAVQAEALAALTATRANGYGAGLVVLATGLGKTYLAAFDSHPFARVLFVAHREEILTQAMAAFRAVRPKAHLGKFTGEAKDAEAEILFASVQTLARAPHLGRFMPDAFDYVVIDEFHHAAAATYRRIIEHFSPAFLMGLTATPDRTDGGDLLGLCEENLVYQCDLWCGIEQELLSPFHYFGVPDLVEYAQIPWRSGRFDEAALTDAVATQARAENALEQLAKRGGQKTIGFCVSRRHADFMALFAQERGLRAVAVHSGETSAPRTSALKALEEGKLDIVFAVDMFNEGVDVPSIDTVLMLRPTESLLLWLQQLGRGLRRADGKSYLAVIDYIGNHRIFLTKARALLRAGVGERALRLALEAFDAGDIALPEGCEVTYDLEALDILKSLIRLPRDGEEMDAFYRDFRERHGQRPTAAEMQHAGFNPARTGSGGWFGFVADMGDLDADQRDAFTQHKAFLAEVETTAMTRSYKMLVLRAMLEAGRFPGSISVTELAERVAHYAARNPALRADISVEVDDLEQLRRLLTRQPLPAWNRTSWFELGPGVFRTTFDLAGNEGAALTTLTSELVEWRITRHLQNPNAEYALPKPSPVAIAAEPPAAQTPAGPQLWQEYKREDIAPLFGERFNTGSWNAGIVLARQAKAMILLVTLEKANLSVGGQYSDHFESPTRFFWQTQTSTKRDGERGKIINGVESGWTVHLFLRGSKLRDGKGAPFRYAGPVKFVEWTGEAPITVEWQMSDPVPEHLRKVFGVGST